MSDNRVNLEPIFGFPEFSINETIVLNRVKRQIEEMYELFGYVPFDTRLVELDSVLNQKGIDSKELYSLNFLSKGVEYEPGEARRKMALRFDLTVPMARYVAQNKNAIYFPMKRYQIQKVYRAEGHKVSQGRFNEFYQCDIDVVGCQTLDINYDSEMPAIIYQVFRTILNIERFVIRISNRKILEGVFRVYGVTQVDKIKRCVKVIDDIDKVDNDTTIQRLDEMGINMENATELLEFFREIYALEPTKAIEKLQSRGFEDAELLEGIGELESVVNGIISSGVAEEFFKVDVRIARGLDYYTGTVYETTLLDHRELGSVCSGGRYNDLVSTLSGNPEDVYPGVGISIGLTRLIPTLIAFGYLKDDSQTVANILVSCQDKKYLQKYQEIGTMLRKERINTDVYLNKSIKLPKQLEYASKKNYKYVIIGNKYEFENEEVVVRDMSASTQETIKIESLVSYLRDRM